MSSASSLSACGRSRNVHAAALRASRPPAEPAFVALSLLHSQLPELPDTTPSTVGALARPVREVDPALLCAEVETMMRGDADMHCLAVRDDEGRLGLLSRGPFLEAMAGPLGYGRALSVRKPVSAVADWTALIVGQDLTVDIVVRRVLERRANSLVHDVLVLHRDGSLGHVSVAALFRDLSSLFEARALLDGLTGLANRDLFLDRLDQACSLVNEGRGRVGVLYIDLDGFKAINDAYGHGAGDGALRAAAARLQRCVRSNDLVARLGGDEFAVLVHVGSDDPAADVVRAVAGRVLDALSEPIKLPAAVVPGRASIGVALSAPFAADGGTLLREADLAMYRAKTAGGLSIAFVDGVQGALADGAQRRPPDRERFQQAMAAGELLLHFQPIVETASGRLTSVEALIRWNHPQRGLLFPDAFLPGLEEAGLSAELGTYVLHRACQQLATWRTALGAGAPPRLNVNLSVRQLLDPGLAETVRQALSAANLPAHLLRLELPEVATLVHMQHAQQSLADLRAAGVAIVLDDLGAGASSLRHLTQVSLDGIKIDRQFVAGMLDDDRDLAVVQLLLQMAHAMDLTVTVEGVETNEQLKALEKLTGDRVCFLQGYLIGRPVSATELPLPWPSGNVTAAATTAVTG